MLFLKDRLESFTAPIYGKTKRSALTYESLYNRCVTKVNALVTEYHKVQNDAQSLREIRNDIDYYIRRYHKYCIEERHGSHYIQLDIDVKNTDFEHLIPLSRVRDLLLSGVLTVNQSLNTPTVRLSRDKHKLLNESGWGKTTPSMWYPFKRYTAVFQGKYATYDGTIIDPETWTLEDHFDYFKTK